MFGVGTGEILAILVIAMVVVGPERMVEFASKMGRFIAQFRQQTDSVTKEFREAFSLELDEGESGEKDSAQEGIPAIDATEIEDQVSPELESELAAALVDGEIEVDLSEGDEAEVEPALDEELDEEMAEAIEPILVEVAALVPEDEDVEPTVIESAVLVIDEGEVAVGESSTLEGEA